MLRLCMLHAWHRTFQVFGGATLILSALAVPVVGFALHIAVDGLRPMEGELHLWLIYTLAAVGIVFLSIYLWNLGAAPFRILLDRQQELSAKLEAVSSAPLAASERQKAEARSARRRADLAAWRKMVATGVNAYKDSFRGYLAKSPEYAALRPHLDESIRGRIEVQGRTISLEPDGSIYPLAAQKLLHEIDRVEREWRARGELD